MAEEKLMEAAVEVEDSIYIAMRRKHIKQTELAKEFGEYPATINRAIKGDISPKSVVLRKKIYEKLDMN